MRSSAAIGIVGAGVKTPAGQTLTSLWDGLLSGRAPMALYEHPDLPSAVSVVVAQATSFDPSRYVIGPEANRLDRTHLLAIGAAEDALASVAERPPAHRCAVVCGVGYGAAETVARSHHVYVTKGARGISPFTVPLIMPNSVAAHLSLRLGFEGPSLTMATACAAGADAIGLGMALLRSGAADLVLAGGVDATVTPSAVVGFYRTGVLSRSEEPDGASRPFDRDRSGFVVGEGAGFMVLRRAEEVPRDDLLGLIVGYAATCDAYHVVAPRADGAGAARCIVEALASASIGPTEIGHINAHGTSTIHNDLAESVAIERVFGAAAPPVTSVKGITGHMIGGSGAVEAIVTMQSLQAGSAPPTAGVRCVDPQINLDVISGDPRPVPRTYAISSSFGFGGHNAVLVLAAVDAMSG
jgi:3-oxoacyl-[acyl-carrier-protein] synthase II